MAKALRNERFNRFVYLSSVVLPHRNPVSEFLQKNGSITNTLACIVRAFDEVEFINVFLVVASLIGIHNPSDRAISGTHILQSSHI